MTIGRFTSLVAVFTVTIRTKLSETGLTIETRPTQIQMAKHLPFAALLKSFAPVTPKKLDSTGSEIGDSTSSPAQEQQSVHLQPENGQASARVGLPDQLSMNEVTRNSALLGSVLQTVSAAN